MYANALYKTGHAKEGYKVLQTLLDTAMDFERSKMYPGIPEYFDNQGRGLYAYLTGAASLSLIHILKAEFNKIVWTDRDTLMKQSVVVIVITVILGVIISVMDAGILECINLLIK